MTRALVIFGDSVTWGQGLLDAHKPGTLVAAELGTAADLGVDMRAHSGAGDFTPQDEVIVTRRASCVAAIPEFDVFAREQCFRASAGHPNVSGARAYATAILAARHP
jgi:hypothetical protein